MINNSANTWRWKKISPFFGYQNNFSDLNLLSFHTTTMYRQSKCLMCVLFLFVCFCFKEHYAVYATVRKFLLKSLLIHRDFMQFLNPGEKEWHFSSSSGCLWLPRSNDQNSFSTESAIVNFCHNFIEKLNSLWYHRITESQNCIGWKGPLEII